MPSTELMQKLDIIEQRGRRYVAKGYHADQFTQLIRDIRAAINKLYDDDKALRERIIAICNERRHRGPLRNQIIHLLGNSDVGRIGRTQADAAGPINDAPHITIASKESNQLQLPLVSGKQKYFVAIPAWGKEYVNTAVKFTVPGILASFNASNLEADFLIYTDMPNRFLETMPPSTHSKIKFLNHIALPTYHPPRDPHPREYWAAFMASHSDALCQVPQGSIICMWNADIVPSIECFRVVDEIFSNNGHTKIVASVGIRTTLDGNECPIGVDSLTLRKWIWNHLHPISQEFIWDKGHSSTPTVMFFEDGENVSMHAFHLTPMFIRVDRKLNFKGTIDDDLMQHYGDNEIAYLSNSEASFAELSFLWKGHPKGSFLNSVDAVVNFGKRRISKAHVRNFKQRFKILGNPERNHPAADQIIARLS